MEKFEEIKNAISEQVELLNARIAEAKDMENENEVDRLIGERQGYLNAYFIMVDKCIA